MNIKKYYELKNTLKVTKEHNKILEEEYSKINKEKLILEIKLKTFQQQLHELLIILQSTQDKEQESYKIIHKLQEDVIKLENKLNKCHKNNLYIIISFIATIVIYKLLLS